MKSFNVFSSTFFLILLIILLLSGTISSLHAQTTSTRKRATKEREITQDGLTKLRVRTVTDPNFRVELLSGNRRARLALKQVIGEELASKSTINVFSETEKGIEKIEIDSLRGREERKSSGSGGLSITVYITLDIDSSSLEPDDNKYSGSDNSYCLAAVMGGSSWECESLFEDTGNANGRSNKY